MKRSTSSGSQTATRVGLARLQLDLPALRVWRDTGVTAPDTSYEPRLRGAVGGALRDQLAYFADCALRGERPAVATPEDDARAVVAATALIASSRRGAEIEVAWPADL